MMTTRTPDSAPPTTVAPSSQNNSAPTSAPRKSSSVNAANAPTRPAPTPESNIVERRCERDTPAAPVNDVTIAATAQAMPGSTTTPPRNAVTNENNSATSGG